MSLHLFVKPPTVHTEKPLRLPDVIEMVHDVVVGNLLWQIVFWYQPSKLGKSKLRVYRHGVHWIAKTREQWMKETKLTLDQYRRAIKILRDTGLVDVRPMKFGGVTMSHVKLNVGQFQEALEASRVASLIRLRDNPSSSTGIIPHSYTETTVRDHSHDLVPSAPSREDENDPGRVDDLEKRYSETAEVSMTADEILKQRQERTKTMQSKAARGPLSLYWRRRVTAVFGEAQKPLTQKEAGQLKNLQKNLGAETRDVIDFAINHWWKFASQAGARAGTTFPGSPHIGFLLLHYPVVFDLMQPIAKPVVDTVDKPVYAEKAVEQEPPHHLSESELADMIAGLSENLKE